MFYFFHLIMLYINSFMLSCCTVPKHTVWTCTVLEHTALNRTVLKHTALYVTVPKHGVLYLLSTAQRNSEYTSVPTEPRMNCHNLIRIEFAANFNLVF